MPLSRSPRKFSKASIATGAAGFTVVELETEDVWLRSNPAIIEVLSETKERQDRSASIFFFFTRAHCRDTVGGAQLGAGLVERCPGSEAPKQLNHASELHGLNQPRTVYVILPTLEQIEAEIARRQVQ